MPNETDEIGAPELPRPTPQPDCECRSYPGSTCTHIRRHNAPQEARP